MKTVGIICEYNPLHLGHIGHIEKTRQILGSDVAVICVMSGNYVQRGDLSVFNKHSRAKMAICSGVDLVIELPVPYVLKSAEGFAKAGIFILDRLGVCDHLSFGSEEGDINILNEAAEAMSSDRAHSLTKEWLDKGISYAAAQQKAADVLLGRHASVLRSPNNVLGIEYIKALKQYNSIMLPVTIKRTGGDHDSDHGYSASSLRKKLFTGCSTASLMSDEVFSICTEEIKAGRGPVSIKHLEMAVIARLRAVGDFTGVPGISEGLEKRFKRYAANETTVSSILQNVKTKRYPMSRLRRVLICAALGINNRDIEENPPYARILAMNTKGKMLLNKARKKTKIPVITKPASVYGLNETALKLFEIESSATDFYVLAYPETDERKGGQEWRYSPIVI